MHVFQVYNSLIYAKLGQVEISVLSLRIPLEIGDLDTFIACFENWH